MASSSTVFDFESIRTSQSNNSKFICILYIILNVQFNHVFLFKKFQTRRQIFGSLLTFHIFDDAGSIYISDNCEPPARQLKQLVRACGGQYTSNVTTANVVVGYTPQRIDNIHEKWILDCITQGALLNKNEYALVNNNIIT